MSKVRHAVTLIGVAALAMTAPILLSVSAASASSRHMAIDGYTCTIVSTKAGATVHGSPNAVVCGLGANSTISAGAGYEVLIAGAGRDTPVSYTHLTLPTNREV